MTKKTKNISASTHQRLLNIAKDSSRPFNELLQHFAIERFMYRLSKSSYADRFILKGALMFSLGADLDLVQPWTLIFLEKLKTTLKQLLRR